MCNSCSKYLGFPLRCVEAVLCLICLGIVIFMIITRTYITVFLTLAIVALTFAMLTMIDILLSHCYRRPIFWNTWLFALSGASMFFLCVGLLAATHNEIIFIILVGEIFNAVTAIIFLLEAILILNILRKQQWEVSPYKDTRESEVSPYKEIRKSEVPPSKDIINQPDAKPSTVIIHPQHSEYSDQPSQEITVERYHEHKRIIGKHGPPSQPHLAIEPNRTRSSISHGGTFPMGNNEAPLPSPEKTVSVTRTSSKRRTNITRSASQTLTTVSSAKLRRGSDGRMYLADGTPLTEVHLPNGDVEYRDANGVAYTRDGIPIFRESSMYVTEPLQKKEIKGYCDPSCASKPLPNREIQEYHEPSYVPPPPAPITVPPNQIEIFRESSRQHVTSQGVVYRDGEWWAHDGRLVPKVHGGPNGKLVRDDKTPLYEIVADEGHIFYESADGFLYNQNGTPIGANADLESDVSRYYEHDGHISKSGHHTPSKSNQQLLGLERPVSRSEYQVSGSRRRSDPHVVEIKEPEMRGKGEKSEQYIVGRSEQDVGRLRSDQNFGSRSGLRSRSQNFGGFKTISETTIHEESIEEESIHEETGDSIRTKQVRESRSTDRTETIIQGDDKTDIRQPQQPQQIAHMGRAQRGRCKLYLADGTPLTEVETASGHLLYQSPDGETFKREGNLVSPTYEDPKNIPPCSRCRKEQQQLVCRQRTPSPPPEPKVSPSKSRTVAVSTRMVPKNQKSSSAAGSIKKCPVKSASEASYHQQPESVYHQVTHNICRCGKKHVQSTSSIQGTISSTTSPRRDDTCPNIKRGSSSPSSSEQTALTTICECECESDAFSSWEATDGSSPQNTGYMSENVANGSVEHRTGTDEVQTSETRIITATDIQKMNTQDTTVRRKS